MLINPIIDNVAAEQYMDNTGNSTANTMCGARLTWRADAITLKPMQA